jgi:hypothetical protein
LGPVGQSPALRPTYTMDRNLYGYGGEPRPPHSGARPFGDIHGVFQTEPTNAFATAASHGSQRAETSLSVAPSSARPRRDSRYYQARQSPPTPSYSYDGQVADQEATNTTTDAPGSPRRKYCSSPPPPFMKRAPKGTSFWDSSLADLGYYQDTGATASRLTQVANDASICKSPSAHFPSPSPSEGSADSAAKRSDSNTAHYQFDCSPQGPGCMGPPSHRGGYNTVHATSAAAESGLSPRYGSSAGVPAFSGHLGYEYMVNTRDAGQTPIDLDAYPRLREPAREARTSAATSTYRWDGQARAQSTQSTPQSHGLAGAPWGSAEKAAVDEARKRMSTKQRVPKKPPPPGPGRGSRNHRREGDPPIMSQAGSKRGR